MGREISQATDFVEGRPCYKCGGTKRYASNRGCVPCLAQWQKDNREKQNEANRRSWAKLGPERQRERYRRGHLKRTYSLALEEYERMYREQSGKCAICGSLHDTLCVDHDHDTAEVRALLCVKCNTVIGQASDSVAILTSAIQYLNNYNKK